MVADQEHGRYILDKLHSLQMEHLSLHLMDYLRLLERQLPESFTYLIKQIFH